jgi:hypothetical protein
MPRMFDDFTGQVFGYLTVIEQAPADKYFNTRWRCRCVCGEEKIIRASQIREGKFFTCGSELCRFWSKVDKSGECWNWTGALHSGGYGMFKPASTKSAVRAHHYSWQHLHGPIPKDRWVLHTCDNRKCVNPAHLYLGTHQDNMNDMVQRGRSRVPRLKVSSAVRVAVREEYGGGGTSHSKLAEKYGVDQRTIRRILRESGD